MQDRQMPEPKGELQTVGRAARILLAFNEVDTWTVSGCARHLGIAKSMAHRLLTTLAEYQLVRFDPESKAYRLGPAIFDLTRAAINGPSVAAIVGPLVREAADRTHETITFCKIQGMKGVCIDFADSPHAMRLSVRRGDEYALNAGAIGKCLLAYQSAEFLEALETSGNIRRYTENTIVDLDVLRQELAEIRAQGFAYSRAEITPDASSVGVPVHGSLGVTRFCLAASGPAARVDDKKSDIVSTLVEIAGRISALFSFGTENNQPPEVERAV